LIEEPIEDPDEEGSAILPQIAVDVNGNAFVVWQQEARRRFNVWSNWYFPDTGWATAQLLEQMGFYSVDPQIAVDPSRHAHAVWRQGLDNEGLSNVATNRFE
jgi:hypothetical protein